MFFGNKHDQNLLARKSSHPVNKACAQMNVRSSSLDVKTFRDLVDCFNADNAIHPIAQIVHGLSDKDLLPLVNLTNQYVLDNPKNLYLIDSSYDSLKRAQILDETFEQLGKFLENEDFIVYALAFVKEAYQKNQSSQSSGFSGFFAIPKRSRADSSDSDQHKLKILKAIEILARRWKSDEWQDGLEFGLDMAGSKAFQGVLTQLKASTHSSNLADLSKGLNQYFQSQHKVTIEQKDYEISKDLVRAVKAGIFFKGLDKVVGKDADEIKANIPELSALFQATLQQDPPLLGELSAAFQSLAYRPITCLNKSMNLPDAAMHLMLELMRLNPRSAATSFVLRDHRITLAGLKLFCDYGNSNINHHYDAMARLAQERLIRPTAEEGVIETMIKMVKPLYELSVPVENKAGLHLAQGAYRPMMNLFENFLADPNGVPHLLPLFVDISKHGLWTNVLLTLSLPNSERQRSVEESIDFWLEPQAELDGESVYDVFVKSAFRVDSLEGFKNLLNSLKGFLNFDADYLEKVLTTFRKALLINDAHPFLDTGIDIVSHATQHQDVIDTLFLISEKAEFKNAIRWMSDMAKDGSMSEITEISLKLFHRYALAAKGDLTVHDQTVNPYPSTRRHNFEEADLGPYKVARADLSALEIDDSCNDINIDLSIVDEPGQLNRLAKCSGREDQSQISSLVGFMSKKLVGGSSQQRSLLKSQVDLIEDFFKSPTGSSYLFPAEPTGREKLEFFSEVLRKAIEQGQFTQVAGLLPLLVERNWGTKDKNGNLNVGPIARPMLQVAQSVVSDPDARADIEELTRYVGKTIQKDGFSKLVVDLNSIFNSKNYFVAESNSLANVSATSGTSNDCDPDGPIPQDVREFTNKIAMTQYPDITWDAEERPRKILGIISEWVKVRECDRLPPGTIDRRNWIYKRACEVVREAIGNRNNWELVKKRQIEQDGSERTITVPRDEWDFKTIRERIQPIIDRIKVTSDSIKVDDSQSRAKTVVDSQIEFMKYFTLPKGTKAAVDERGIPHFQPEQLAKWLYDRSVDYQLITYYYVDEEEEKNFKTEESRRVRLVNSLDRLEIVLNNVDFYAPQPIGKNLGLVFS